MAQCRKEKKPIGVFMNADDGSGGKATVTIEHGALTGC